MLSPMYVGTEKNTSCDIYGYALHSGEPVALLAGGAEVAVSGLYARLRAKERIELSCGYSATGSFKGENGYEVVRTVIVEQKRHIGLIYSKSLLAVMPGTNYTYVMGDINEPSPHGNTITLLGQRVSKFVNVPLFSRWYEPVIRAGISEKAITFASCHGMRVYAVNTNPERWTEIISELVRAKKISL